MSEIKWVPIPDYEGLYEISSSCEIRSVPRKIIDNEGNLVRELSGGLVQIHKTSSHPEPYVVLHNGIRYNKEDVEDLMKRAF